MDAISITFSTLGSAKPKLLSLVPFGALTGVRTEPLRSLNLEHVSPDALAHLEIQRRTPLGSAAENAQKKQQPMPEPSLIALMRKWFWSRKPEAAFLLTGFPSTVSQAKILDEWLETRDESLDGVICTEPHFHEPVALHYRSQGLLMTLDA